MSDIQTIRDLALMDRQPLCGLSVRPLSIRTFVLLKQCGNPFIVGGVPSPADLAVFLWFHSPEYCLDEKRRKKFMRGIRHLLKPAAYARSLVEVNRHLAQASLDAPDGKLSHGSVHGLIDLLASQYGWGDALIMDMPIARAFIYRQAILRRLEAKKV